jgi:hypothetical protein
VQSATSEEGRSAPGDPDPSYSRLPAEGPDEPLLGGALITWVEPAQEHVVAYNRWYEDDHMITGAMSMPWMFSSRRWVAPKRIQHLRGPVGSRIAEPLEAGKYIGLYWINAGRIEDHQAWAVAANLRLHAEGRGSCRGFGFDPLEERRHVFTAFCDYRGPVYRDGSVPRDVHTLLQPYQGLVVEFVEADDADREALHDWLRSEYLHERVAGEVACALSFDPRPLPRTTMTHVREVEGRERLIIVLYFLEGDPRDCWDQHFAESAALLRQGRASLAAQAAFVPTRHGTDTYTDELF